MLQSKFIELLNNKILNSESNVIGIQVISHNITSQKQAEVELKESEERFRELVDTVNSGVAIYKVINDGTTGSDYIIQEFNKFALQHEQVEKEQVIGKSLKDIRPNIDKFGLVDTFRKVWKTGEQAFFPAKVYIDDKYSNYYENRVFKIPSGEIVAVYDDVTVRENARMELNESEASLRDAQRIANIGNWFLDLQTGHVEMSDEMIKLVGFKDKDEALDVSNHEKFYTPESWQLYRDVSEIARSTGKGYEIEMEFSSQNTKFRHCVARGEAIYDDKENIYALKGTLQDITDRKMAEKAILDVKNKLEKIIALAPIPIIITDMNRDIEYFNDKFTEVFGYTLDDVSTLEKWWLLAYPDNDYRKLVHDTWEEAVSIAIEKNEQIETQEWNFVRKDQKTRIVQFDMIPLGDFSIITLSDVTESRQAEANLKYSEEMLRDAQRIANIGNWTLDLKTGKLDVSDELINIIGFKDRNEALEVSNHEKYYTPESWRKYNDASNSIINNGASVEVELEFSDKNKKFQYAISTGEPIFDGDNNIIGLKGTVQDITHRKKAEENLKESEERLKLSLEATKDGIWDWNIITNKVVYSNAWRTILEIGEVDNNFKTWEDRIHPEDREKVFHSLLSHFLLEFFP